MEEKKTTSPWPGPAGLIPVTSGAADDANLINRRYLDSLLVEMRVIDAVEPCLDTVIYGHKFASPIMMPAFSHLNKVALEGGRKPMREYAQAARKLNVLNWVGTEPDDEFAAIVAVGAPTVRIIKPWADHDLVLESIAFAQTQGALAVGIDIDHIVGNDGHYDVVDGMPLGPVSLQLLHDYAAATSLPFIAKGVLSVDDALKARDAGCRGVLVSHHHGRVPYGLPPTRVLPDVKQALEGSGVAIFCDCGIDSGYDAYKALALGADAVAVGRGMLPQLLKQGAAGVVEKVKQMNVQLKRMMMYTGIADTGSFDSSVIHHM